ncbi:MAG: DUF1638 domain-containing protein [Actinobacteria bacterium]|nr:DUF1638 domain-containing protein [Actinomycetota bacterium]
MKLGVIACDMIKREFDILLEKTPEVEKVVYLQAALHIYPEKMKQEIKNHIDLIKDEVDVVFLGYGYCQSLKGIEHEVDIPVVLPQYDDCISMLLTPERYGEEVKKEVGTWFMTPGWAEIGAHMVIKELKLDRAVRHGKDPLEMAKRLFTHYRRGLYIDTGVGDNDHFLAKAEQFCGDFNLTLETTVADSKILQEELAKCKLVACKP